ncbi:alginate lyase family protein [Candidatus Latescibacterota bacterium]
MLYFSHRWLKRSKDWRSNPWNGHSTPLEHWTDALDFVVEQGDIKWIWEPSRFDWAYTLGRAWFLSGDERHAEVFWSLLEDWARHNPPNSGINWKCGQECALRMMALVWSVPVFGDARASTPARARLLWRIVTALAQRIEPAIGYAVAQFNNHSLSEALGLFVAGASLSNHPRSQKWLRKGRRIFEQHAVRQFASDGSYTQNSMNYERLALKLGVLYALVCKSVGQSASDTVTERLKSAAYFLRNLMDNATGYVPNYGANDGANLMALSSCEYRDFRPVLQLAGVALMGRRFFSKGLWDEESAWLCGKKIGDYPLERTAGEPMRALSGGYYCLRQNQDMGFIRCHTHKSRPGHADMLHLDLWRNGVNLLCDSGTYQYYDLQRNWGDYFSSTVAHNTLTVDRADQMTRLGKFLWGSWTRSRVIPYDSFESPMAGIICEHDGYIKRYDVRYRRAVLVCGGEWVIIDDAIFTRKASHTVTLTWHLDAGWEPDATSRIVHYHEAGATLFVLSDGADWEFLTGAEHYPETLCSRYYGDVSESPVLKLSKKVDCSYRFVTLVAHDRKTQIDNGRLHWHGLKIPIGFSRQMWS